MNADVEKLRERISKLKGEIAELRIDRLTQAETSERLTAWVDSQAQKISARSLVLSATSGTGRINPDAFDAYGSPQGDGHAMLSLAPYLCWLDPEAMKKRLIAELDNGVAKDYCSAQKPQARKTALAKAESELDDLERQEEAAIVEAEAGGQFLPRRPDCRPEIVLEAEAE